MKSDSRSKPDRATTAQHGVVHESGGAKQSPIPSIDPTHELAEDVAAQIESLYEEASNNPCTCGQDEYIGCRYCSAWHSAGRKAVAIIQAALTKYHKPPIVSGLDEWRCVNCKRVLQSSSEPEKCSHCGCREFAHIVPAKQPSRLGLDEQGAREIDRLFQSAANKADAALAYILEDPLDPRAKMRCREARQEIEVAFRAATRAANQEMEARRAIQKASRGEGG